jgi:hypothetical protein
MSDRKTTNVGDLITQLHDRCSQTIKHSFDDKFAAENGASYSFATDLDTWIKALEGRPEQVLLLTAANEYTLAFLNAAQGQYRNAFKSLRLTLELTLQAIYLSANLVLLNEWLKSHADTSWAAILDQDNGVLTKRFVRAFCHFAEDDASSFRNLAGTLYREMSECIHGNVPNKIPLPKRVDFDKATFQLWHAKAETLQYIATSGNPRLLLKTIAIAGTIRSTEIEQVIKEFFREAIWSEHSGLGERYPGHKEIIDWGRSFIEHYVIPNTIDKNLAWAQERKSERTCFFWIHRDAPEAVREGLRLLMYTGIVTRLDAGVVATRSQIGTRYAVNIGCLASPTSAPIAFISDIQKGLSVKRMTEYGAKFQTFADVAKTVGDAIEADVSSVLAKLLKKPIFVLDISEHQKKALVSINVNTLGEALNCTEADFMKADYIGPKRSRLIKNVVTAAIIEYLSG